MPTSFSDRFKVFLAERAARLDGAENEARRRWTAMALSGCVAFALWFSFSMLESYSVVVEMPLVVRDLPDGQALRRLPNPTARVTVQGEGWELFNLRRSPPTLEINAQEAQFDVFSAASEGGRLPPGVSVQSVVPDVIEPDLEPRIERALPVRPRTQLAVSSLYELLGEPTVDPDTVVVAGARSIVNSLSFWPTERLVREDVGASFTAPVALSDTLAGLVSLSLREVNLSAAVAVFTEAKRDLEVRTEGTPPGGNPVRLIPSSVTVTYSVPMDEFARAKTSERFYAVVDYASAINDTTGTVQPMLNLPQELHVRNARITPRRLEYRILVE
ncbi:MAG: hypothetical protein AAGI91_10975 [Bacteroidota bacterium]